MTFFPLRGITYDAEYPASSLLRAHPPPHKARSGPRGPPVDCPPRQPPVGLPVLPRSPCAHIPPPIPRWYRWTLTSLSSPPITAFPVLTAGRLPHHPFRGLHSVHSRCGLRARRITYVIPYTEGSSRFVTSTTAPIATGGSESRRAGLPPAGKSRLFTAHVKVGP